jgi:hypothetical protein
MSNTATCSCPSVPVFVELVLLRVAARYVTPVGETRRQCVSITGAVSPSLGDSKNCGTCENTLLAGCTKTSQWNVSNGTCGKRAKGTLLRIGTTWTEGSRGTSQRSTASVSLAAQRTSVSRRLYSTDAIWQMATTSTYREWANLTHHYGQTEGVLCTTLCSSPQQSPLGAE